jgi:hypothetical protein
MQHNFFYPSTSASPDRIFLLTSDLFLCFAKVLVLLATCIIRLDCSTNTVIIRPASYHGTWNSKRVNNIELPLFVLECTKCYHFTF